MTLRALIVQLLRTPLGTTTSRPHATNQFS